MNNDAKKEALALSILSEKKPVKLAMKRGDFVEMGGYRFEIKFVDNEHGELRLQLVGPVEAKELPIETKVLQ